MSAKTLKGFFKKLWGLPLTLKNNKYHMFKELGRGNQSLLSHIFMVLLNKISAVLKGKMGYYQNNLPCLRKWNHQPWYVTGWVSFYILKNGLTSKRPSCIVHVPIHLYDQRDLVRADFFFLDWMTPILQPLNFFMSFRSY